MYIFVEYRSTSLVTRIVCVPNDESPECARETKEEHRYTQSDETLNASFNHELLQYDD